MGVAELFCRRSGLWSAALVVTALVAACATNPVTGKREFTLMSESQEIALGRESDAQIRAEMGGLRGRGAAAVREPHRRLNQLIRRPREIYVQESPKGVETVAVVSADGVKQILHLKDPLMLPAAERRGR
jgi:hypothetical protein